MDVRAGLVSLARRIAWLLGTAAVCGVARNSDLNGAQKIKKDNGA